MSSRLAMLRAGSSREYGAVHIYFHSQIDVRLVACTEHHLMSKEGGKTHVAG